MPTVTFVERNRSYQVPAGKSFLEMCQENDAPHAFGCTVGSCGTCRLVIVSGAANVDPATDDEIDTVEMCTAAEGARLGCQLVIRGDITVKAVD